MESFLEQLNSSQRKSCNQQTGNKMGFYWYAIWADRDVRWSGELQPGGTYVSDEAVLNLAMVGNFFQLQG
jgi:hypothetical protein